MSSKPPCPLLASSALFSAFVRLARHTFCCTTTWAKSMALSAPGDSARGGTGAISNAIADAAREAGRRNPHRSAHRKDPRQKWRGAGSGARKRRRNLCATLFPPALIPISPSQDSLKRTQLPGEFPRRSSSLQVSRLVRQSESRARRTARFQMPARRGRAPARRDFHFAHRGIHGARVRPSQVRRIFPPPLHRYGDSHRSPILPSLRRESTSFPASCSTRRTNCARAHWDDQREAFGNTVIDTIAEYAPNMKNIIIGKQVHHSARYRAPDRASPKAIFFRANFPSSNFSFCVLLPVGRDIALPLRNCTCAAPPPIPAAASWARPAASPRWKF